jgi:hypothetical protein
MADSSKIWGRLASMSPFMRLSFGSVYMKIIALIKARVKYFS